MSTRASSSFVFEICFEFLQEFVVIVSRNLQRPCLPQLELCNRDLLADTPNRKKCTACMSSLAVRFEAGDQQTTYKQSNLVTILQAELDGIQRREYNNMRA